MDRRLHSNVILLNDRTGLSIKWPFPAPNYVHHKQSVFVPVFFSKALKHLF